MKTILSNLKKPGWLLVLGFIFAACEGGLSPKKLSYNEIVTLEDGEVKILNIESATSLTNKSTGNILTAPEGKKFLILSYELKAKKDGTPMGFGIGIYKNDTETGIADENRTIPGVFSIKYYLDAGYKDYLDNSKANEFEKRQTIYMVDKDAKGLKVRVGQPFSWKNLHSIDLDTANIQQRKGAEVLAEMKDVMKAMNGKADNVDKAVKKYLEPNAPTDDIGLWASSHPSIVTFKRQNGIDYYSVKVKAGATKRMFDFYWRNGKIAKIVDKGLVK